MTMTWNVLRALAGLERGRPCRHCREDILGHDQFGMSEGICAPCRSQRA